MVHPKNDWAELDELRRQSEEKWAQLRRSRFHKSTCPVCGEAVTNQAMGRKAHMEMHKRRSAAPAEVKDQPVKEKA